LEEDMVDRVDENEMGVFSVIVGGEIRSRLSDVKCVLAVRCETRVLVLDFGSLQSKKRIFLVANDNY
jgi:hypothetical protein